MYPDPNQNQPQQQPTPESVPPQYSIDYLNQIAPKPQKKGLSTRLFVPIAIGGGLLVLIVGFLSLVNGGSGPTTDMETLAARIATLTTISASAQKNIKSNDLLGSNSNLTILLTNANHDIATPLMNNGIDIKKLDPNIIKAESGTALTAKLEDARLNAVFDRTYAREMSYQLTTVETLMQTIYNGSKSKSMKDFLQATDNNLSPIKKQFDTFDATSA
jgi:hypothetical protein